MDEIQLTVIHRRHRGGGVATERARARPPRGSAELALEANQRTTAALALRTHYRVMRTNVTYRIPYAPRDHRSHRRDATVMCRRCRPKSSVPSMRQSARAPHPVCDRSDELPQQAEK
jgi:hypothetical protein